MDTKDLRTSAKCIHLAIPEEGVANDVSKLLKDAADEIDKLRSQLEPPTITNIDVNKLIPKKNALDMYFEDWPEVLHSVYCDNTFKTILGILMAPILFPVLLLYTLLCEGERFCKPGPDINKLLDDSLHTKKNP